MRCEDAAPCLDDYVDGLLDRDRRTELARHLESCAACRVQERALAGLLDQAAALPKELEPARDLWPGIGSRIRARGGVARFPWRGGWALAAAAAVLVALSSAVTTLVVRRMEPMRPAGALVTLLPAAGGADGLLEAERDYARASATLLQALAERGPRLSPATRAAVDKNLLTIDRALAQIREALRERPGDAELELLLTGTHRRKLEMLQQVVKHSKA